MCGGQNSGFCKASLRFFYVSLFECKDPWMLKTYKLHEKVSCTGVEIRLFCLTGHFWCWCKSHCSSPIATKGCNDAAVIPLFSPAFTGRSAWFVEH